VLQRAAQDDSNDSRPIRNRGRAKESIDRRPMEVLLRTSPKVYFRILGQQVKVGRRHVYMSWLGFLIVFRMNRRQRTAATQDSRQLGLAPGWNMENDKQRSVQTGGQSGHQFLQGLHAASGGSHDNNIPLRTEALHPRELLYSTIACAQK